MRTKIKHVDPYDYPDDEETTQASGCALLAAIGIGCLTIAACTFTIYFILSSIK